jgi:peptidoglycan/xylan/chitin deacetylase (PgdA/CDA1 family)
MKQLIPHRWRRGAKRALGLHRRGGVLMYHRVCHARFDPWDLCVTPENFDAHMAGVAAHRAGRRLESFTGNAPLDARGRSIAVTFDDGYADNLINALPALERHDVPATIFIVPSRIGCGREFWWDGLCRAIFSPARLPSRLDLRLDGLVIACDVAPDGSGDAERDASYRADEGDPATPRQALCLHVWTSLLTLSPAQQDAAIEALLDWAGVVEPADPGALPLTVDQLAELARHPLITLGNHTETHAPLDLLSPARVRDEILNGGSMLEALTGAPTRLFCFPYGRLAPSAVDAVRASGATLACECAQGVVTPLTRPYKLPRIQVIDQSGASFLGHMRGFGLMEA